MLHNDIASNVDAIVAMAPHKCLPPQRPKAAYLKLWVRLTNGDEAAHHSKFAEIPSSVFLTATPEIAAAVRECDAGRYTDAIESLSASIQSKTHTTVERDDLIYIYTFALLQTSRPLNDVKSYLHMVSTCVIRARCLLLIALVVMKEADKKGEIPSVYEMVSLALTLAPADSEVSTILSYTLI